jgi:hypothetical protein
MIDTPTLGSRDAWRQRYQGTYGFLKQTEDSKVLCHITNVDSTKVVFNTSLGSGFFANMNSGIQFEFLPVTRGWFYTKNLGWVLLQRVPARQYHRGISENNTVLSVPLTGSRLYNQGMSLSLLEDIFINKPKAPDGVLLSRQVLIHPNNTIYLYDLDIGTKSGNTLMLRSALVKQEIVDQVRRMKLDYKVEVNE